MNDEEEVKSNWEKLKLKEGKKSILSGVPPGLPAMVKSNAASRKKPKQVGFEWDNKEQVWGKVEEESRELREALTVFTLRLTSSAPDSGRKSPERQSAIEEEFGDLVFSTY